MGLIADYVEANRERALMGDIDPCMIVNPNHALRVRYTYLREAMQEYSGTDKDVKHRKDLEDELRKRAVELDAVRANYILSEKAILEVLNSCHLESTMMEESLKELCFQMREAYRSVCDVLQELNGKLKGKYEYQAPDIDEGALRLRLLDLLLNGIVGFMNNDTTMDTSSFRKVIADCASLIRVMEDEPYHQPDKNVVQNYMVRRFALAKGKVRCPNCRELLYSDIPYCMNCYMNCDERKHMHE